MSPDQGPAPYEDYRWDTPCQADVHPGDLGLTGICNAAAFCPEGTFLSMLYGLKNGEWHPLESKCRGAGEPATPTLTPADVARAFQRIPLPELRAIAQPGTKTLVNLETIFHVDAEPLTRTVTLLNQRVDLDITPTSFHWTWGNGRETTTTSPGAPYPSKAVTHRYLDADETVHATVTVTWTARWRTNGGAWADVPGSVRTTGPAAALRVVEAVPNLAGRD